MAKGFIPNRGYPNTIVRRYPTRGHNANQIFLHDVVQLTTHGEGPCVTRLNADSSAAGDNYPLGVAVGLYDKNQKPLIHKLPDSGPYIPASTEGYVDVIIDENMTYTVECIATVSANMLGMYCDVTMGTAVTAIGRSGFSIGKTVTQTYAAFGSVAGNVYPNAAAYIIGLAGQESTNMPVTAGPDYGTNQLVEVKLMSTPFGFRKRSLTQSL